MNSKELNKLFAKKSIFKKNEKRRGYPAHTKIGNAVRDGKLIKPDHCTRCNRTGIKIEGHHDDYSKPLDVIWLCVRCHRLRHKELRELGYEVH
jgi:hypothetical protein